MDAEARPSIRMQRPSGSGFGATDDEQYSAERRENTKGGKGAGGARGRQNRSSGDSRYLVTACSVIVSVRMSGC